MVLYIGQPRLCEEERIEIAHGKLNKLNCLLSFNNMTWFYRSHSVFDVGALFLCARAFQPGDSYPVFIWFYDSVLRIWAFGTHTVVLLSALEVNDRHTRLYPNIYVRNCGKASHILSIFTTLRLRFYDNFSSLVLTSTLHAACKCGCEGLCVYCLFYSQHARPRWFRRRQIVTCWNCKCLACMQQ